MTRAIPLVLLPVLLATLSAAPASAQAREEAPNAVVLSNGQRWERHSLRYIDVRTLALLSGATLLPTADPSSDAAGSSWWTAAGLPTPVLMLVPNELGSGLTTHLVFLQGGGVAPGGSGPGGAAAGGAGFSPLNPRGLPVLADPVTNSLIVDP